MLATPRRRCAALLAALFAVAAFSSASAEVLPQGLKIEKMLDSAELGDLAQSPTGELWLLERATGTVRVLANGREVASLTVPVDATCESGLLDVAFAPDYGESGIAFLSYVDPSGHLLVDRALRSGSGLALDGNLLDLGTTAGGCRPGGGLAVGPDGKLYVATGDLEVPADAQSDASEAGKVLRVELDGSVPPDNASGTRVWAKGFRDGRDLAINPATARAGGTVYVTDLGASDAYDEVDSVAEGANYGWATHSGPGGGFAEPLVSYSPSVQTAGLDVLRGTGLGADSEGAVAYACTGGDDLRRAFLTGPDLDQLDRDERLYDPDGDRDGTPDPGCPKQFSTVASVGDGWLYGSNVGVNPGVWRIWRDDPGPREVSAAGSPFGLTVGKSGNDITIGWENLGTVDTGRPARNGGQRAERYRVWEGTLPIGGTYDHQPVLDTNGTADGSARLVATLTPGAGSRYFLVSAQGDNKEGSLGPGRPAADDYCDAVGWGVAVGKCAEGWVDPSGGGALYLTDYNPRSATYMRSLTMADFRGSVVRMDISADDCFWCNVQAGYLNAVDAQYRSRDYREVTVFTLSYTTLEPVPPAQCASYISAWANDHNLDGPILCDVDHDANNRGDVTWQYFETATCGGTPQNFYIDQGHVIYDFVCGAELSSSGIAARVAPEVNPETCE